MLVQLESCMQKVFLAYLLPIIKEDLAQVAYKLISLDNEKYYHLRQNYFIASVSFFSEERYAEIFNGGI